MADDIDTAMKRLCAADGPFELLDVVGNDVSLAIQRELYLEFREPGFAPAPLLEHLVTAGYLGRKTKRLPRLHHPLIRRPPPTGGGRGNWSGERPGGAVRRPGVRRPQGHRLGGPKGLHLPGVPGRSGRPATPHAVAWPVVPTSFARDAEGLDERRHWHNGCWSARHHRR